MPYLENTLITKITRTETGWGKIYTDHDQVKVLETKDANRLRQANEIFLSGQRCTIDYTPKEPRQVGDRVYRDNWFNSAVVLAQPEPQASLDDIPLEEPTPRRTAKEDAWRIALTSGAKLAVQTLPLLDESRRDFHDQAVLALAWATWIYTTQEPGQIAEFAGGNEQPYDPAYAGAGDDIPF